MDQCSEDIKYDEVSHADQLSHHGVYCELPWRQAVHLQMDAAETSGKSSDLYLSWNRRGVQHIDERYQLFNYQVHPLVIHLFLPEYLIRHRHRLRELFHEYLRYELNDIVLSNTHSFGDGKALNSWLPVSEKPENREKKRFLYGVSMGGSVALLLHRKDPAYWDGAVLLAPMCKISDDMRPHPIVVSALKMVCAVAPSWRIIPTPDIIDKVCKDPEMRKQVRSNPYIYRGNLPLKTCHELLMVSLDIEKNLHEVTLPFLVLHGGEDIVTDPSVSKLLYEEASSRDKTFKLYPGMWHALTAELPDDVEHVYSDIISWMDERAECTTVVSEMSGTPSA
uniref:Serine aminopeptidase S33 domain-containing protein n=1 Tax=Oryza brachyantha TaxID=4533 RepID=J3L5M1_ORYBR